MVRPELSRCRHFPFLSSTTYHLGRTTMWWSHYLVGIVSWLGWERGEERGEIFSRLDSPRVPSQTAATTAETCQSGSVDAPCCQCVAPLLSCPWAQGSFRLQCNVQRPGTAVKELAVLNGNPVIMRLLLRRRRHKLHSVGLQTSSGSNVQDKRGKKNRHKHLRYGLVERKLWLLATQCN